MCACVHVCIHVCIVCVSVHVCVCEHACVSVCVQKEGEQVRKQMERNVHNGNLAYFFVLCKYSCSFPVSLKLFPNKKI